MGSTAESYKVETCSKYSDCLSYGIEGYIYQNQMLLLR